MSQFYITTPIYYPNDDPHIGHALNFIGCDMLARYHRMKGDEVFFSTGTDEHGQKIHTTAGEQGITPLELATKHSDRFKEAIQMLNVSYSQFIRTTDPNHHLKAQEFWKLCEANDDIYKKAYKAMYCVGCETFKTKTDLDEDGKCPDHPTKELKEVEEENYFFKLSKYQDQLLEHYEKHPEFVQPDFRRNEMLSFIKSGLEDISVSREKTKLPWGIPVPGDEDQVMYVWFDALTNYLSNIEGQSPQSSPSWWPADAHVVGKDISRHHTIMWPAMLMSADIELPRHVMIHGFIISGGIKMGKSNGNVIDPFEIMNKYGVDPLRLILLQSIDFYDDGDLTDELIAERYNTLMANGIGNLCARSITMAQKFADTESDTLTITTDDGFKVLADEIWRNIDLSMKSFLPGRAIKEIFRLVDQANLYIEHNKPWSLAKNPEDAMRLQEVIANLAEANRQISLMLRFAIPETSDAMRTALALGVLPRESQLSTEQFETLKVWGGENIPTNMPGCDPLFPRLEK